MSAGIQISGRVIAAARGLAGISEKHFSDAAGISVEALRVMESGGSAFVRSEQDVAAICRAMDHFGVMMVEESDGMGAGVRLKFTRQDARQMARMEGEGGIVGSDDAP